MSDVVSERGRIGTKLATQLDSEGKLLEFDIREDEEQNIKLQETIELLLVAGYFRARIKGLGVFDKDLKQAEEKKCVQKNLATFQCSVRPQRAYKRINYDDNMQKTDRINSTLMEYGLLHTNIEPTGDENDSEIEASNFEDMSPVKAGASKLSASTVASLIDTQHIQKVATEFKQKQLHSVEEQNKQSNDDDLLAEIETLQKRLAALQAAESDANQQMVQLQKDLDEARRVDAERSAELEECEKLERECPPETMLKLTQLKSQHDTIKAAEAQFKLKCQMEIEALDAEIARLQTLTDKDAPVDATLSSQHAVLQSRLKERRLEAAELSSGVSAMQRALDTQPSRAELNQYHKRFMELYNQEKSLPKENYCVLCEEATSTLVGSKHRETKQFYTLYNTLVDVRALMQWQNTVIDSVEQQYSLAVSSDSTKAQFINQLETIVDKVHQRKYASERKQTEVRMERDVQREQYQELMDQQRLYHKTVADFKQECRRNEELTQAVQENPGSE